MVKLSRKNSFDESDEEDPMAGVANLVDAMLVIAVGLLVFLVISWNMQAIVFNEDVTPEQRQDAINAMKQVTLLMFQILPEKDMPRWVRSTRTRKRAR